MADMERANDQTQSQLSSPGGKHGVAYAGGAQSGPISPPKEIPIQRLVRNNPERVSPKEFIENAVTGANTRKPRDRTSQSSIPPIPSNGSPHSRTPEHRRSPSYPLRTDSPQPYSHYDYSQARVPTPSGLRKVETISPPPANSTKLSNSTPPLQSMKAKSPDRSLPLQEEPEDHHDDYDIHHHGSPTPSSDVYPEGRPGYDLKPRGGRDSAGRRIEDDDSATLNEDLSDEDDNHVPKPGQRDESSSSGFTPRSPSVALPDMNQRPDYHQQSTLRSRPRGGVTDQLGMRGFEQIFDQATDSKRLPPVTTATNTTPPSTAPRIPPVTPPQNKDDKPSSQQQFQDNQSHPATVRQNQAQNPQRPHVPTQAFYPPHLYPEDFYDPTAAYLQSYLSSPGNRPQAPIPPTPHSQTTAPSPSPLVHLPAGGYDLEQYRNVGSPYPHPFSHVRRNAYTAARTPSIAYDPNDPNVIREQLALQMQIYALNNAAAASSADSTFSPSSTSFPAPGYNPWAFVPTMRGFPGLGLTHMGRGGDSTMSLRSSPSHEPVQLPLPPSMAKSPQSRLRKRERSTNLKAVQERLMNGGRSRSKLVPPRVDSTQPRDTSPEMTDGGEETAGEEVHTHVEGDADKWDVNGVNGVGKEVEVKDVVDAVQEIAGDVDDDADWIDQDEEDDDGNDLLDLPYHPSYVRDENKRRRRWENKWEALNEAFNALDRQTDTTMILVAAPPHSRKLYSLMSRSVRRDPMLINGESVSSVRRSFRQLATQRRLSRVNHAMSLVDRLGLRSRSGSVSVDSMGQSDVGSSESREDDLRRALEAALGSLDALGNIYEERENRWREEMKRLNDDRNQVELLLSQTFGKFSGMGVGSGGSGESTVNGQTENLILV